MISFRRVAWLLSGLLVAVLGASGCDSSDDDSYADDGSALPDADEGSGEPDGGTVGDAATGGVAGTYLLAIQRPLGEPLRFLAEVSYTPGEVEGGTAEFSLQALKVESCAPSGDGGTPVGDPIVIAEVVIDGQGAFEASVTGATIDPRSNPQMCQQVTVPELSLTGQVQGSGAACGEASGQVTLPPGQSFNGSTFGAVRVAPGTVGDDNLPEPVTSCSER